MSENVKYYFKKDCTERCPHIKDEPDIGSVFCLYMCKHNIKKDRDSGWIICEKLNEEVWRKKSEELIKELECDEYFEYLLSIGYNPSVYLNKLSDILSKTVCNSETILNDFKNTLTNITKMKKENINIEIPKGYVPEIKDGKVTLVYKGDPLDEMPKSWKELKTVTGEYICCDGSISEVRSYDCKEIHKDIIPKGLGEPMLALIQLLQLRNRTWEVTDSKPKHTRDHLAFSILYNREEDKLVSTGSIIYNAVMTFKIEPVAKRFLELHKDLLWEARELL